MLTKAKKTYVNGLLVLGLAIALYTLLVHFQPSLLYCPSNGVIDCALVLKSIYSTIFGIPLALLASAWFITMLLLFQSKNKTSLAIAPIWLMLGLGGIAYSITAQFLLGKVCIYCLSIDTIIALTVALFVV